MILAVETSCDETAVALLRGYGKLEASLVFSQAEIHAGTGGVVPEVASRNHLERLPLLARSALEKAGVAPRDVAACAATAGPGLAPALLVGLSFAKGLALGLRKPFYAIDHIEGHLLSPFFGAEEIPVHLGLVVSGGHTLLVEARGFSRYSILGRTVDDAAGEAFDKVAKLLGLGYPGGALLDRLADRGDPRAFAFPRSMLRSGNLDFSFSGLKTAVRYLLEKGRADAESRKADICASFREAVVDILVGKCLDAARRTGLRRVGVSGGVAANRLLRVRLASALGEIGAEVSFPPEDLRTDNAAMIAFVAAHRMRAGAASCIDTDIHPSLGW